MKCQTQTMTSRGSPICMCTGTDEDAVIEVVAKHNNEQRQEIKSQYKQMYGEVYMLNYS